MEAYVGMIFPSAIPFAPQGFMLCQGQLLTISQNQALFAVIGTTYGGNGSVTFQLPDLRGRTIIGVGQSPGTSNYVAGQVSGSESTTLLANNMPTHTHALVGAPTVGGGGIQASHKTGIQTDPTGNVMGNSVPTGSYVDIPSAGVLATMGGAVPVTVSLSGVTLSTAGGSQPFSTLQPYLSVYYMICTQGIFPTRQ